MIDGEEKALLPDANNRLLAILNRGQMGVPGKVPVFFNRTAFGDYMAKLGFQPFKVNIQPAAVQNNREGLLLGGARNNPNQIAEKLFGELDADADGLLSNAEITMAPGALAKQDFDQDETISTEELVPTGYAQFFISPSMNSPSAPQTAFLSVTDRASLRTAATQLTAKYDTKERDNALSRDEVGIAEWAFPEYDIDASGKWDFEEIQQYLRSPKVDVLVKVQLGNTPQTGQPAIEFEHNKGLTSEVKNAIGSLNLSSVQLELSTGPEIANVESLLKGQIQSLDPDNNGYLDEEEIRRLGAPVTILMRELDKDNDGKLFIEEIVAGVLPVVELMTQEIHLTLTDRGRDLFRILDSNADSRLSKRELWAMPHRAALWDKDNDGQVGLADVPQQYRLVAGRGDFNILSRISGVVAPSPFGMPAPRSIPVPTAGPMWFQKMDRNADGDVSFKEFLGTLDEFEKLDRDGDSLISPQEAAGA
jgi:Ca2+-binding EF-hand superfamily protein